MTIFRLRRLVLASFLGVCFGMNSGVGLAQTDASNNTARTTDTTQDTRTTRPFDYGWLGLLGLIGLAGMMGRSDTVQRADRNVAGGHTATR